MPVAFIFPRRLIRSLIRSLKSAHWAASRRTGGSASPATTEKGTVIATTGAVTSWPLPSMARASPLCEIGMCTPQASRVFAATRSGDAELPGDASASATAVTLSKRVCCRKVRKSLPGQRSPARWSGAVYEDVDGCVTSVTTVCIIVTQRAPGHTRGVRVVARRGWRKGWEAEVSNDGES